MKTHFTFEFVEYLSGHWLECGKEVLLPNRLDTFQCVSSIKDLVIFSSVNNRNLVTAGLANYAETFKLRHFKIISIDRVFESAANDKYVLLGPRKDKGVLIDDFRWSKVLIPWHDMLLLLVPKNNYSEYIVMSIYVVIFTKCINSMQVMAVRQK